MNDKDNKVVNTEEQNRAVNPGSGDYQETSPKESLGVHQNTGSKTPETEKPEKGADIERPHRIEGDDADGIERKIPNL